jgi:RNA polymerase sigma-70 factor, ECF subfamily
MIQPDKELFSCLRSGDERAYGKLVNTFHDSFFLYAKSIVGNPEVAKEIINDVFVKVWEQRLQVSASASIRSYLYRMVHNAGIDYLRRCKKNAETSIISVEEIKLRIDVFEIPDSRSLYDGMFSDQFESAFNDEMEKLPDQCREIFILCRYDQLTYQEIASRLNISLSTVKTQMVRAMMKLKDGLKEYL